MSCSTLNRYGENSIYFGRHRDILWENNDDTVFVGDTKVDISGTFSGSGKKHIPNYWLKSASPDDDFDQEGAEDAEGHVLEDWEAPSGMVFPHVVGMHSMHGFEGEEVEELYNVDHKKNQLQSAFQYAMPHRARPKFMPRLHADPNHYHNNYEDAKSIIPGQNSMSVGSQLYQKNRVGRFNSLKPPESAPFVTKKIHTKPTDGIVGPGTEMYQSANSFQPYLSDKLSTSRRVLRHFGDTEMHTHKGLSAGDVQNVRHAPNRFGMFHRGDMGMFYHKGLTEVPDNYNQNQGGKRSLMPFYTEGGKHTHNRGRGIGYVSKNMTKTLPKRDVYSTKSEFYTHGMGASNFENYDGPWRP